MRRVIRPDVSNTRRCFDIAGDEFTFRFDNRDADDVFALVVLNLVIASGIRSRR